MNAGARKPQAIDDPADERRLELLISNLLRAGVWASLGLVLLGTAIMFAHHPEFLTSREALDPLIHSVTARSESPLTVARGAADLRGRMLIMLGLLLLIGTPVLRVAVSLAAFARRRDRAYVAITSLVLLLLLLSFLMGHAG